jgi:hypothetical protein
MSWMCVTLSSQDVAAGRHRVLQAAFEHVFTGMGAPKDAAMIEKRPTFAVTLYYFSPAAVSIFGAALATFGAQASAAPSRSHAKLMVGHDDARQRLLCLA